LTRSNNPGFFYGVSLFPTAKRRGRGGKKVPQSSGFPGFSLFSLFGALAFGGDGAGFGIEFLDIVAAMFESNDSLLAPFGSRHLDGPVRGWRWRELFRPLARGWFDDKSWFDDEYRWFNDQGRGPRTFGGRWFEQFVAGCNVDEQSKWFLAPCI